MNYANRSVASSAGNVRGQATRDQVQDPNASFDVPAAAQVPITGMRAPATPNLSGVGSGMRELANAIEGFDQSLTQTFYQTQDQWRLEGQLAYTQGKTEADLAKDGNFYSQQGWQAMSMRASMAEWVTQQNDAITQSDHTLDPTAYRDGMVKSWADANKNITDPFLQKYNTQLAESYFPALIEAQARAHNTWKVNQTKTAYGNMLTSVARTVDPNDPGRTAKDLSEMVKPGSSGLNQADENERLSQAMSDELSSDSAHIWEAVGGEEGMKARKFSPADVEAVRRAYQGYIDRGGTNWSKQANDDLQEIVQKASIDGNASSAREAFDAWSAKNRTDPNSWSLMAANTNPVALRQGLTVSQSDPVKREAVFQQVSQPAVMQAAARLQALKSAGKIDNTEFEAQVSGLATKAGVSNEDIKATLGVLNQSMDQYIYAGAAKINSTLQSQYEKQQKAGIIQQAITNDMVWNLPEGDQQKAIDTYSGQLIAQASVLAKEGRLVTVNGDVEQAKQDFVEQNLVKWLARQNIVDKTTKNATAAVLGRNILDSKGNVDDAALSAYNLLIKMHDNYGMTWDQVYQYTDGRSRDLFSMAQTFDAGGQDSSSALKHAFEELNRPQSERVFTAPSKNFDDIVRSEVSARVSEDQGWFNRIFGNNAEGIRNRGHFSGEFDRAVNDPSVLSVVRNTALTLRSYNPALTEEAATKQAVADVMGRSAFVSGKIIMADGGHTLAGDMGLQNTGEINHEQLAVLEYMKDHAGMPIDQGGFGPAWDQFKVFGSDPYASWLYNHTAGIPGQMSESLRASILGAQPFNVWYDANNKLFRFQMFSDTSHTYTDGAIMEVPASVIGQYYLDKHKGQPSDIGQWWAGTALPAINKAGQSIDKLGIKGVDSFDPLTNQ